MAASSLSNLLSSLLPSKPPLPPPPPPAHLPLPKTPSSSSLAGVAWSSLAYSNTLSFKSACSVQVIVQDNEPEEKLIGRFRRAVLRAGVLQECKRRRFFENNREKAKRKSREAARKNRKRYPKAKDPNQGKQGAPAGKKDDDEDDNWDYEEVDYPYH